MRRSHHEADITDAVQSWTRQKRRRHGNTPLHGTGCINDICRWTHLATIALKPRREVELWSLTSSAKEF